MVQRGLGSFWSQVALQGLRGSRAPAEEVSMAEDVFVEDSLVASWGFGLPPSRAIVFYPLPGAWYTSYFFTRSLIWSANFSFKACFSDSSRLDSSLSTNTRKSGMAQGMWQLRGLEVDAVLPVVQDS